MDSLNEAVTPDVVWLASGSLIVIVTESAPLSENLKLLRLREGVPSVIGPRVSGSMTHRAGDLAGAVTRSRAKDFGQGTKSQ